jgi:hypothetical protein
MMMNFDSWSHVAHVCRLSDSERSALSVAFPLPTVMIIEVGEDVDSVKNVDDEVVARVRTLVRSVWGSTSGRAVMCRRQRKVSLPACSGAFTTLARARRIARPSLWSRKDWSMITLCLFNNGVRSIARVLDGIVGDANQAVKVVVFSGGYVSDLKPLLERIKFFQGVVY